MRLKRPPAARTAGSRLTAARRFFSLRVLVACMLSIDALAATGVEVFKYVEGQFTYLEWRGGERIYQVRFDSNLRLHWDDSPLSQAVAGSCPPAASSPVDDRIGPRRRVLLAHPRVDELRCPDGSILIQGLDATGQARWQRPRGEREIIGRTEQGLVTTDLEVWAPDTGEILLPASARTTRQGVVIPRYRFHHAALHRPTAGDFILYDPQPHASKSQVAGLYRLSPASGAQELLLADQGCGPLGLGRAVVADMRIDPDGRYLYLQRRCSLRGHPPRDTLAVLDTATRAIVFEDRYDPGQQVAALALADNGDLGVALQDPRQRQVRLLRYRLSVR